MKKTPLLNCELSYVIAQMGHFDTLAIGDAGLPIPRDTPRIDLAVTKGVPELLPVLKAVLSELNVQKATIAVEMQNSSPALFDVLNELIRAEGAEIEMIPHEEFKERTSSSVAVVRTGEMQSYANIILESGVVF